MAEDQKEMKKEVHPHTWDGLMSLLDDVHKMSAPARQYAMVEICRKLEALTYPKPEEK